MLRYNLSDKGVGMRVAKVMALEDPLDIKLESGDSLLLGPISESSEQSKSI